jgi:acid stress-induced BolA-like protein IbaG/YrbA
MKAIVVEDLIRAHLSGQISVSTRDEVHFEAVIISEAFRGVSRIKRQQMVYAALGKALTEGHVHAISLKTLTPEEHQEKNQGI